MTKRKIAVVPIFAGFTAISFSVNCQRRDYNTTAENRNCIWYFYTNYINQQKKAFILRNIFRKALPNFISYFIPLTCNAEKIGEY